MKTLQTQRLQLVAASAKAVELRPAPEAAAANVASAPAPDTRPRSLPRWLRTLSRLVRLGLSSPATQAPAVTVRRVTPDRSEPPRKQRPEPPRPPRRTLAIGPHAPRAQGQGGVVVALRPGLPAADNIFREDFTV